MTERDPEMAPVKDKTIPVSDEEPPADYLLQVEDLRTYFYTSRGVAKAVNGVRFGVKCGEIVGIVGESGSGKSVTALSIMGLVSHPGRVVGGRIIFQGEDLLSKGRKEMQQLRGRSLGMIFQDPVNHLDPLRRIGVAIAEVVSLYQGLSRGEALDEAEKLLRLMKVPSPSRVLKSYPFELSGGMCQRAMIAMALAGRPVLLIADECTSSLDATVQASILKLLDTMRHQFDMSILLTTHNMSVISKMADRTIVMYGGNVMEIGATADVLQSPRHPYTRALVDCIPTLHTRDEVLRSIPGEVPSPLQLPTGCPFVTRCPIAQPKCHDEPIQLRMIDERHWSSCHFAEEFGKKQLV